MIGTALMAAGGTLIASATGTPTEYRYDDGVSNVTFGPPGSFAEFGDIDMLWGNYFFAETPGEVVVSVSFGLGELSPGNQVSVWVFDDPDDDADPTNAVPLFSLDTTAFDLGFDFNEVAIPSVPVDGGFFVAVGHLAELTFDGSNNPDYPSPGRFDPDGRADRSWFFYDSDIPEDDLGSSGFVQRMDGPFVPIQGAFAIRATTTPTPATLLAFTLVGSMRSWRRNSSGLLLITFGAALLADLSMVFGVAPFFFVRSLSPKLAGLFSAGAAGMMACAGLVQLVGEGLDRAPGFQAWEVAVGLGVGALFYAAAAGWIRSNERFDLLNLRRVGGAQSLLIVAVMTVHSAPEGVAIGVAFGSRETGLGIAVVSALAVHNIPEAVAITLALRANGVSTRGCLGWALFTSIPQPLVAPFAAWFVWLFEPLLPFGMGLAAGAMTYLVVDDLLPEAFEKARKGAVASAFTPSASLR